MRSSGICNLHQRVASMVKRRKLRNCNFVARQLLHGFVCHALGYDHIRYAEPLHDSPLYQMKCCSPCGQVYHDAQIPLIVSPCLLRLPRVPLRVYDPSVELTDSTE